MSTTRRGAKSDPITPAEALQLLQSAIGYLQLAGVTVQARNSGTGLSLTIPGAYYVTRDNGKAAEFCIGTPPASPAASGTPWADCCKGCGRDLVHDYGGGLCRDCWTARNGTQA